MNEEIFIFILCIHYEIIILFEFNANANIWLFHLYPNFSMQFELNAKERKNDHL
jgi:hypothetical protein